MYQLAPITLRPEVRASRAHHGEFQNKITSIVDKVSEEKEVIGLDHREAKLLFNTMDTFFSYGLFSADKTYWCFVREFLPRTEQEMLKAEWGNVNDRRLSLAWLKDAFNKGSLSFQMLAFQTNKHVITRFYHRNACMNNFGMLEAVTGLMERIITVQFSFYSQVSLRSEPMPAVAVEPPSVPHSRREIHRRRRRDTEKDRRDPVRKNIVPPSAVQSMAYGTPADPDLMLDELMSRSRRNRLNSEHFSFDKEEVDDTPQQVQSRPIQRLSASENIDELFRKTMSQVRMEHVPDGPESKSFDSLLHCDELAAAAQRQQNIDDDEPIEGEEIMNPGDILQLAMDIFQEQGEKLFHMYHIYESFAVGNVVRRLLAITGYNIYIVSKTLSLDDSAECPSDGSSKAVYFLHAKIPLQDIDYIGVALDHQVLIFNAKEEVTFTVAHEDMMDNKMIPVSTGEKNLGIHILEAVEQACKTQRVSSPIVLRESVPYSTIMKRHVGKELSTGDETIKNMTLVYWKESSPLASHHQTEYSGYLYWRFNQPNWWRKPPTDLEQSFFLLPQDRKLYVFKDSTMKEGVVIYDLRTCSETLEMDQKKDYQWSFEIVLEDGNLQLCSPSKEELVKWMQRISSAVTQQDDDPVAACLVMVTNTHIVVAQEGNKCMIDGFVRTLVSFPISSVKKVFVLRSEAHMALLLCLSDSYQWLFFRSEAELNRMVETLSSFNISMDEIPEAPEGREALFITTACARIPDLWMKPVYDDDVAEVIAG